MAVLSTGASGAAVADLQRRLAAMGYNPGPIDGRYGPRTAAAVKAFQQSAGIAIDGVAGPQTQAALAGVGAAPGAAVEGPAAAGNALAPEGDPQFLAFQRALGVSEDELRATVALARGRTQRDLALRLPQLAENQRAASQNIADSYEARGIGGAGHQKLDILRSDTGFSQQRGQMELNAADSIADLERDLALKIAQGRRETAEQATAASQRRALGRASLGL